MSNFGSLFNLFGDSKPSSRTSNNNTGNTYPGPQGGSGGSMKRATDSRNEFWNTHMNFVTEGEEAEALNDWAKAKASYAEAAQLVLYLAQSAGSKKEEEWLTAKVKELLKRAESVSAKISGVGGRANEGGTTIPSTSTSSTTATTKKKATTTSTTTPPRSTVGVNGGGHGPLSRKGGSSSISSSTSTSSSTSRSYNNYSTGLDPKNKIRRKMPVDQGGGKGAKDPLEDTIRCEMMERSPNIRWDDVAGLIEAKQVLKESVVLPNLRPDLFVGLRSPARGVLMFGPPGTGKTLLAKAVAAESGFAFFSISASSLMSKWVGEGEKMVKALFSVARQEQPSVIFIDEIDSILSARKDNENESSRRMKTEFLVQLDGASVNLEEDRILIMAATNLPWALDEAVLRRMTKKVYIPLPDPVTRKHLITRLLQKGNVKVEKNLNIDRIVQMTDSYSCSDINSLCKEAAMGPLRSYGDQIATLNAKQIRGISFQDFQTALGKVRPSVTPATLDRFQNWFRENGYEN